MLFPFGMPVEAPALPGALPLPPAGDAAALKTLLTELGGTVEYAGTETVEGVELVHLKGGLQHREARPEPALHEPDRDGSRPAPGDRRDGGQDRHQHRHLGQQGERPADDPRIEGTSIEAPVATVGVAPADRGARPGDHVRGACGVHRRRPRRSSSATRSRAWIRPSEAEADAPPEATARARRCRDPRPPAGARDRGHRPSSSTRIAPRTSSSVVRHLGSVQIDPTAAVARTEHLVLWSRLGRSFDPADLARQLDARRLFEYRAFIYPIEDYPLLRPTMEAWPDGRWWLPHAGSGLPSTPTPRSRATSSPSWRSAARCGLGTSRTSPSQGWRSRGWTNQRNLTQMLDYLSAQGRIAVAGRAGNERLWDIADRVLPTDAAAAHARGGDADPGAATPSGARHRASRSRSEEAREEGVEAKIEGVRGTWRVEPELLDRPFKGRTALLSPFDRLVYDRAVTKALFDFEYRLEIYVPVAEAPLGLLRAAGPARRAARRPRRCARRSQGRRASRAGAPPRVARDARPIATPRTPSWPSSPRG